MLSPFFLAALGAVAQASAGRVDTVRLSISLELTEARTPVAGEFGVLTGLALDRAGNLYVADVDRAHIWVFDSAGRARGTIGRKGEGPGEFTVPSGIAFDAQERLYVRDLVRVSRFRFDASRGLVARFDTAFRGPLYPNWRWGRASRFDSAGRLYYPRTVSRQSRGLPTQNFFYRYSAAGQLLDSLAVPAYDNFGDPSAALGEWPRRISLASDSGGHPLALIDIVSHLPASGVYAMAQFSPNGDVSGWRQVVEMDSAAATAIAAGGNLAQLRSAVLSATSPGAVLPLDPAEQAKARALATWLWERRCGRT